VAALLCVSMAQENKPSPVLMEVREAHSDVVRTDELLLLRIRENGTVEYDVRPPNDRKFWGIKNAKLPPETLKELIKLIDSSQLRELALKNSDLYDANRHGVDYFDVWRISLRGNREIKLTNFDPRTANEKGKPYPASLVALGCLIRTTRDQVAAEGPNDNTREYCYQERH
jgi:hypothetical protein